MPGKNPLTYVAVSTRQTNKYNKISNFLVNRDHSLKSKERRVITYRNSSGHLIDTIQSCQTELGIKCQLEYLQM